MTMDIHLTVNDLRTLITTLSFIVFAAIVFWAWSGRQRARFDEAALLPFADDDLPKTDKTSGDNSNGAHS
jgi:cytochrome c oxidase cbb3-type subunit IV